MKGVPQGRYTKEFCEEAVKMVKDGGMSLKWTPSQGQFLPKLRCASFCLLIELFMLPFGQLSLPNTPQQVFFL